MLICPRYERVRALYTAGNVLSPPLILDLKNNDFLFCNKENKEIWYDFQILKSPFKGGVGFKFFVPNPLILNWYVPNTTVSSGTRALNGLYVAGLSGPASGNFFWQSVDSPITDVYFAITAYTGTAANVNDILVEIRPYNLTTHLPDTTTLIDSVVKDPASATNWIKVSGFNASPTFLNPFFVIIGDPDGTVVDFATVQASITLTDQATETSLFTASAPLITTTGFASGNTYTINAFPSIVLVHADGSVQGNSIRASATHTNNSVERGIYLGDVPFSCSLYSVSTGSYVTNNQQVKVYEDGVLPGGTALATASNYLKNSVLGNSSGAFFTRPFPNLRIDNAYRVVLVPAANNTQPLRLTMGGGSFDDNLRKARPGYGQWYFTDAAAGPVWTDTVDELPSMALIIEDFYSEAGSTVIPPNQRIFPRIT